MMKAFLSEIPQTVSVEALAVRLDVSAWTVRSWLRQGRVPYFKVGKRVLVKESDVVSLLERAFRPASRS